VARSDTRPVETTPAEKKGRRQRRAEKLESQKASGALYPRWYWPSFALPAIAWLLLFFVLPFYVIFGIAFGTRDPVSQSAIPIWQPWWWTGDNAKRVYDEIKAFQWPVFVRTFAYVLIASVLCILIGYVVAYYVARFGGKWRGLYLALLIAPFFISYLMRMLAWINLLQSGGYVAKLLNWLPFVPHDVNWLGGNPVTLVLGLVYGYVPYMILPLYGFLDSIGTSLLEAGRDLGASPGRTFMRVTLPLSRPAILAGVVIVTLPMFGDYYTHDLLSPSTSTSMVGNILDETIGQTGHQPQAGVYVLVLVAILLIPMAYYLVTTKHQMEGR
jgi:spermidine/putrescine transport system permease protein